MNNEPYPPSDDEAGTGESRASRTDKQQFKKLKRPMHASKRSKAPERLRGMHRRRRKRMGW